MFLVTFLLVALTGPVLASGSFGITQTEFHLKTARVGGRITEEVEVYNKGNEAIHISAYASDWDVTNEGDIRFTEPGTTERSCAPWIKLNPAEFSVPAKQSVKVRFTVTPPAAITREYWGMLFFQSRPLPSRTAQGMAINISTRFACKVFIAPSTPSPLLGKIIDMDLQAEAPSMLQTMATDNEDSASAAGAANAPMKPTVRVKLQNDGDRHFRVNGTAQVLDNSGQVVATGKFQPQRLRVLSGRAREVSASFDKPLPAGTYTVKAVLDYGGKQLLGGQLKATIAAPTTEEMARVSANSAPPEKSQAPS